MTQSKGMHTGTVWLKADLQCHTPRDPNWDGGPELPGGSIALEESRLEWGRVFVKHAVEKGLRAIAVTDHHDVGLVQYVIEAAKQAEQPLVVFPGVEVTCSDNAQCLALFDPEVDLGIVRKFISSLTGIVLAEPSAAKTSAAIAAKQTTAEVFELVADDPSLREHVVLLPHFSDEEGYKNLNSKGHHPRFANLACDGVYIEKPFADLDTTTVEKVHGKVPEWGTRRHAIVPTGDNRSASFARLGAHPCWIKLGEKSIESLRQALLADEARVAYVSPSLPADRIIRVTVKSSLFGNEPITVALNGGFTALIGGRGSGKTAFLEYLRFGLGRSNRDLPPEESASQREREEELVEDTLAGGFVEVELEREGVRETWKRDLKNREAIAVTASSGDRTTLTLDEARRRFRSRAFHQKGLSTTMRDPSNAADQITGIAAAEALEKRRNIDLAIDNARRAVSTALQQMVAHWQARLEHRQARERADDLKARLAAIAGRLSAHGVSPENIRTIEEAPIYGRAKNYLTGVDRALDSGRANLEKVASEILTITLSSFKVPSVSRNWRVLTLVLWPSGTGS